MHDLRFIRENPEQFDKEMARRGFSSISSKLLDLDESHRSLLTSQQEKQQRRNVASKEIGKVKAQGGDASELMAEVAALKKELPEMEEKIQELKTQLDTELASLPNIMDPSVPEGADEDDNVEIRRVGTPKAIEAPKDHVELGETLGMMDFATAAKLSGARFTMLRNDLARLERALGQFMLDVHTTEHGYTEVSAPFLVHGSALFGTSQLPKFEEDLFKTTDGRYLIPTSEVPLTNIAANEILDLEDLPLRLTSLTPCFRSEAGSAGRDTRGMIRQHQFWKVEMVSICAPDKSEEEHERMTNCAENILKKLDLPFRTVALCSGDIGFGARKTYDLEVWIPSQDTYREISSCSNCWDFQARRMKARTRPRGTHDATQFVHTLNGSGVAVGRAMVAIMENYQQADGSIVIPDILVPYMNGQKVIAAK